MPEGSGRELRSVSHANTPQLSAVVFRMALLNKQRKAGRRTAESDPLPAIASYHGQTGTCQRKVILEGGLWKKRVHFLVSIETTAFFIALASEYATQLQVDCRPSGVPRPSELLLPEGLRGVSDEHPIFCAIEQIACHSESDSSGCSRSIRTARSRASWESLLVRAMTPSPQGMAPPAIPGRFRSLIGVSVGVDPQRAPATR